MAKKKASVKRIFEEEPQFMIINGKRVKLDGGTIDKKKAEAVLKRLKQSECDGCDG